MTPIDVFSDEYTMALAELTGFIEESEKKEKEKPKKKFFGFEGKEPVPRKEAAREDKAEAKENQEDPEAADEPDDAEDSTMKDETETGDAGRDEQAAAGDNAGEPAKENPRKPIGPAAGGTPKKAAFADDEFIFGEESFVFSDEELFGSGGADDTGSAASESKAGNTDSEGNDTYDTDNAGTDNKQGQADSKDSTDQAKRNADNHGKQNAEENNGENRRSDNKGGDNHGQQDDIGNRGDDGNSPKQEIVKSSVGKDKLSKDVTPRPRYVDAKDLVATISTACAKTAVTAMRSLRELKTGNRPYLLVMIRDDGLRSIETYRTKEAALMAMHSAMDFYVNEIEPKDHTKIVYVDTGDNEHIYDPTPENIVAEDGTIKRPSEINGTLRRIETDSRGIIYFEEKNSTARWDIYNLAEATPGDPDDPEYEAFKEKMQEDAVETAAKEAEKEKPQKKKKLFFF